MDNADRGVAKSLFACEPMMRGPGYGDAKCRDEVYKTLVSVGYKLHGEKLAEYFPEQDILYIHIPPWRSRTALERIQAILMEARLPKVVRRQGKWYLGSQPDPLEDHQILTFNTHAASFKMTVGGTGCEAR